MGIQGSYREGSLSMLTIPTLKGRACKPGGAPNSLPPEKLLCSALFTFAAHSSYVFAACYCISLVIKVPPDLRAYFDSAKQQKKLILFYTITGTAVL